MGLVLRLRSLPTTWEWLFALSPPRIKLSRSLCLSSVSCIHGSQTFVPFVLLLCDRFIDQHLLFSNNGMYCIFYTRGKSACEEGWSLSPRPICHDLGQSGTAKTYRQQGVGKFWWLSLCRNQYQETAFSILLQGLRLEHTVHLTWSTCWVIEKKYWWHLHLDEVQNPFSSQIEADLCLEVCY